MNSRTISPIQGGDLITDVSATVVGPDNYTRKVNMRFEDGSEKVISGYDWFQATPTVFPENVTLIHTVTRPNGDHCIVCGTPTTLYRWTGSTWWVIGTGFDPNAGRWRAVNLNGYVFFNNGSDLPCYYRVEFGTIPTLLGTDPVNPGEVLGSGGTALAFGGTPVSVVPLYELREQGIAYCAAMEVFYGQLVFGNVTEIISGNLANWMNGPDPYSRVQDTSPGILTRTPYRLITSDYDPLHYRLGVPASVQASSPTIIRTTFPLRSINVGDKLDFRETEEDGDDIDVMITGATVTSISADMKEFTVELGPDETPIVTDSPGFLVRNDWGAETAAYYDAYSDGSAINDLRKVGNRLLMIRQTGFSTAYTVDDLLGFDKDPYIGPYRVHYPGLFLVINDDSVIFRAREDWYVYNLVNRKPQKAVKLNLAKEAYDFEAYDPSELWMADNEIKSEALINTPDGTLVYSYEEQRCYTMDATFTAHGTVYEDSGKRAFLSAVGTRIVRHDNSLFTRCGQPYSGLLQWGYWGKEGEEVVMASIVPTLSSTSPESSIVCNLYRIHASSESSALFASKTIDPYTDAFMNLHAQSPYFQEEMVFSGPVTYAHRTVSYRTIRSLITRHGYSS